MPTQAALYDISPPISEALAVYPGDTPPTREIICRIDRGDPVNLSALHATVHLGAHADAPRHYSQDAPGMDACDLDRYLGRCQVVRVAAHPRQLLTPADVPAPITAPRVLLATGTYPDPTRFTEDYAGLTPELIDHLQAAGVILVGVDTPSVDAFNTEGLPAHHACLRTDIHILEGLMLSDVPPGEYELIALPLRLVDCDGSPVRAVLRTLPTRP
ncbi:MAG TPA: cyclase family protein [Phycisphaerae bacterium]|nr:cyclase family protein [Phycisphaerales bacterium]HRX84002.1 cyclase family protein [Phycisphaerae bacterium]